MSLYRFYSQEISQAWLNRAKCDTFLTSLDIWYQKPFKPSLFFFLFYPPSQIKLSNPVLVIFLLELRLIPCSLHHRFLTRRSTRFLTRWTIGSNWFSTRRMTLRLWKTCQLMTICMALLRRKSWRMRAQTKMKTPKTIEIHKAISFFHSCPH